MAPWAPEEGAPEARRGSQRLLIWLNTYAFLRVIPWCLGALVVEFKPLNHQDTKEERQGEGPQV
jgi:hypothetical protein